MFDNVKNYKKKQKDRDEELKHKFDNVEFEKNDKFALFIAAFITFVPVVAIVLGAFFLLLYLFFGV